MRKLISIIDASVSYRSGLPLFKPKSLNHVLKGISFDIYEGDSIGIIGRNGVGKSTLLSLLNGIIKPNSGSVINYGYSTTLLSLNVSYDINVSGYHNAILSGMMLGINKSEMIRLMPSIISYSELGEFINQPIKNYSTGMKQRLGFAVAININSDILLIDEILGVGDARFMEKSKETMRKKLTSGDTVVLVSHHSQTIKSLCNKAIWIEDGKINRSGDAKEVIEEYEKFIIKEFSEH
ncbi:ATP-binding cassette domain-containing protein [Vibrio sp. CAIM 722]|uniref:ATP-binding cassette domain-containing protein n=1 Tax=Vibrio eleionomae TaxID=2653505 RepID=A0A7X4LQG2_9VIBR|nr:ATP-binding cassette domain-containing protein [Vibrio eleionomae]MZI96154.1 ATP-binding cassette domain-containing protein [Vibrio eleionomae]